MTNTNVTLTKEELNRYSRHLILPEFGVEGQKKLKASKVLLIGSGGLGSPVALYLAAAGVGQMGLVDFDVVDVTNLQRQIIHGQSDVGRAKVESAKASILEINPFIKVELFNTHLNSTNAMEIFKGYDLVVDGTDNFPTRYLVNDACVLLGIPYVYGSIFRFEGQATIFADKEGPCYRCLYPEPPPPGMVPSCAEGGVIGVLPGVVGTLQATEAVKYLAGIGQSLVGRLLLIDALSMKFRELKIKKDPSCPICGNHRTVTQLIDYEMFCGMKAAEEKDNSLNPDEISVFQLKEMQDKKEKFTLIDVREANEYAINQIEGSVLAPLSSLESEYTQFEPNDRIVLQCYKGGRSMTALNFLRSKGFKNLKSLAGGIKEWREKIDPSLAAY
jgi:molybdopterin/thiamine biosynthesis adenylyltransferase/rhodanese-related sulfurtransferase